MRNKTKSEASQQSQFSSSQGDRSELLSKVIPFLSLSQIKSQLAENEPQSQTLLANNPGIQKLKILQEQITSRMYELDELNCQYYQKQEKLFLKTFVNMMDRMSNQMLEFKQKYRNIDEQINQMQECVELRKKLEFFKNQCLFLNNQLQQGNQELCNLQTLNKQKQQSNQILRNQLLSACKSQQKYKCRQNSLESKLDNLEVFTKSKKTKNCERSNRSMCSNINSKGLTLELPGAINWQSKRPQTARINSSVHQYEPLLKPKQQVQTSKIRNKSDYSHRQSWNKQSQTHRDIIDQGQSTNMNFIDRNTKFDVEIKMIKGRVTGKRGTKYRQKISYEN